MIVHRFERGHRLADLPHQPGEGSGLRGPRPPGEQAVESDGEIGSGRGIPGWDLHALLGRHQQREVLLLLRVEVQPCVPRETAVEDDHDPVGPRQPQLGHDLVAPRERVDEGVVRIGDDPGGAEQQVQIRSVGPHQAVPGEVDDEQPVDLLPGVPDLPERFQRVDGARAAPGRPRQDEELPGVQDTRAFSGQCLFDEPEAVRHRGQVGFMGVGVDADEHRAMGLGPVLRSARVVRRHNA
ncbi:hypothetical protein V6574_29220 [Streptomyces sp. SM1P]